MCVLTVIVLIKLLFITTLQHIAKGDCVHLYLEHFNSHRIPASKTAVGIDENLMDFYNHGLIQRYAINSLDEFMCGTVSAYLWHQIGLHLFCGKHLI